MKNTEYRDKYNESDEVKLLESQYKQVKKVFSHFTGEIILKIKKKYEDSFRGEYYWGKTDWIEKNK